MKRFSLIVSIAIGIILVTVQCSKKDSYSANEEATSQNVSTRQKLLNVAQSDGLDMGIVESNFNLAQNEENPFDYCGQIHYVGLERLQAKILKEETENLLDASYTVVDNLAKIANDNLSKNSYENTNFLREIYRNMKKDFTVVPKSLISECSPTVLSKFEEVKLLLKKLTEKSDFQDEELIINEVKSYENKLIKENKADLYSIKPILVFTSTFRYSLVQWKPKYKEYLLEKDAVFFKTRKLRWWHWLILAGSDAAGYALGNAAVGIAASKFAYEVMKGEEKQ